MFFSDPSDSGITFMVLTDCNRQCEHCLRGESTDYEEYTMPFETIKECLSQLRAVSSPDGARIYVTGGEATLWHDGRYDICDVLIECSRIGHQPVLATNGLGLEDLEAGRNFLEKYVSSAERKLIIWTTADPWHGNMNVHDHSILAVDNFLKLQNEIEQASDKVELRIQSTMAVDAPAWQTRILMEYLRKGILFRVNPLVPWGKGIKYRDRCPSVYLEEGYHDKLGNYKQFLALACKAAGLVDSYDELDAIPGRQIIDGLQKCGATPCLINSGYYHCLRFSGHPWFRICKRNELSHSQIERFYSGKPVLAAFRKYGHTHVLEAYADMTADGQAIRDHYSDLSFPVGFPGCSICEALHSDGLLNNINEALLSEELKLAVAPV